MKYKLLVLDVDGTLLNDAKLGILCGSIVAGVAGWLLLAANLPRQDLEEDKKNLP